jgi:formate--tetrahydrofolate ligase
MTGRPHRRDQYLAIENDGQRRLHGNDVGPCIAYADDASLWDKISTIASRIYGASEVTADAKIRGQIKDLEAQGYGHFPVCVAKTQYSFSTDPALRGAPTGHSLNIREVRLAAGAEFIVMVCGDIMTMPGLPKVPSSERIDLVDGQVVGLF